MSLPKRDPDGMTFLEHLGELRVRILRSLVALGLAFVACYIMREMIFYYAMLPLEQQLPEGLAPIGTSLPEAFLSQLVVTAVAALVVSCPYWFYQLWIFVSPGMHKRERGLALPFVFFASLFFVGGMAFGYLIVFPIGFAFFLEQYENIDIVPQIKISQYLSFSAKLLLAFGLSFELPIVAFFLGRLGIVGWRTMLSSFKYAIIIIFVAAAVFTPPDVISQLLLAGPLILLYGGSILLVALTGRRDRKDSPEDD